MDPKEAYEELVDLLRNKRATEENIKKPLLCIYNSGAKRVGPLINRLQMASFGLDQMQIDLIRNAWRYNAYQINNQRTEQE